MKMKNILAVLLTALLFVPFFGVRAENIDAFELDERQILYGMNRSWLQGYEPAVTNGTLTLILPIRSELASGAIRTELVMPDESISPFKQQQMYVQTQRGQDGIFAVTLKLAMYADRMNGDFPCTIRIIGIGAHGESLKTEIPYVLHIRDGEPNTETARIQISDIQTDFSVGEDAAVMATLTNPCKTVTFTQIALRISDSSGEIIPQDADVLYLPDLLPGESAEISFPMTVKAKASVSPHSLRFELSWNALGQAMTQTESYTRPVRQEIRLEQGGLKMASSVIAGDSITMTLPLMNMGRADVVNTLATLSIPGIVEKQSVLVGTIVPGETKQAQLTLTPGKGIEGDFEGTLTVEATDNDGNPTSFSVPVQLTVEKPVKKETGGETTGTEKDEEKPPIMTYALGGGCGLLLLLLILQGVLLRKKIHRLEEEKL